MNWYFKIAEEVDTFPDDQIPQSEQLLPSQIVQPVEPTTEKREVTRAEDIVNIGQRGLSAEAQKYNTFEEFEKAWLGQIKHGLYWHVTYDPTFIIDTEKGPKDMSSMSTGHMDVGKLMITSHLQYWAEGYMDIEGTGSKPRGYAAIIDMSGVPNKEYYQVNRGFGNEFFVSDPTNAKVLGVLPIRQALEFDEAWDNAKPQSSQELRNIYEQANRRSNELV